jgi:hypothetical protein
MDLIGHDLHCLDLETIRFGYFKKKVAQILFDLVF